MSSHFNRVQERFQYDIALECARALQQLQSCSEGHVVTTSSGNESDFALDGPGPVSSCKTALRQRRRMALLNPEQLADFQMESYFPDAAWKYPYSTEIHLPALAADLESFHTCYKYIY